jgi:hypothetical protein
MAREVGKSDGTEFLATLLYLPLVPASRAEHCSCQWQETAVNKGVKHAGQGAETLTINVYSIRKSSIKKEWGTSF